MILHWLLLTLLGHQYFVLGDDTFVCPSDTGVFPHPESDTQFYRCESGKPALQDCATGTFDAGKGACSEGQAANSTSTASPKSAKNDNKTTLKTSPSSAETTTKTSEIDDTKVKSDEKSTATAKPASDADSTTQKSSSTAKPGDKKAKKNNETVKDSTTPSTTTTTPSITTTTKSSKGDDSSSTDKKKTQKIQDETQKPKAETFRAEADYDYNYDYSDDYRTYGDEHKQPTETEKDHAQQNEGHGDHAQQNEGHGDHAQQNEGLGNHGDHGDHVQQNDGHGDHSKVEEKFNCPNESGFYRHPANCSRFFWCIQWQPTPMYCAEGTAFDPDNHVCSWIVGSDGCGGQLAAPGYQDSHHSFDRLKRSVTDDVKDFDDVNFVPDNYKLSPRHRRQASDYDYYYDSDDGHSNHDHSNKDEDRREGPKEGRSFGLDSKDVNFGAGSATTPYQCPGDGFYADPHDCSVFYHCASGKPYRHQCQPGTAFNKDKYVCSWPLEADGCGGMLSVPYQADVQADDENFTNPFTIEDKEDSGFECPDDVNGYYPDPTDCRHFFQCVEAQKFRHKCANGTAFNIESGVCTWPMSAKSGCGVVLYRAEVEADHPQKALGHKKHHKKHAGHPSDRKRRSLPSWASGALFRMADDPAGKKQKAASPKAAEKKQENRKAESSAQTKTDASTDTGAKNSGSKLAEESSKSASSDKAKTSTSSTTTTASTPPTTTTTTTTAPGTKTDKVEPLPGVVDSIQRTSAWPWESVVRKRKQKSRADYITTKAPSKTTTTQTTDKKSSSSSSSSTTTTVKSATTKKNTTPKASTTSSTTTKSTTTTTTTTKAPEPSTLAVKHPKAEAYRVSTAETDFRCPAPTGHFRDPMNCAIYYHCVDDVAFRKECPDGNLYDINFHRCLPINEVKDCRLVDEKKVGREDEWLSHYPESNSYPKKVDGPREFECDVLNGYFRNHEDCSAYVECLDGVAFHRKCMTGTVFDATRKKCTWSSLVPDCRVTFGSEASEEKNYQVDGFQCPTTDGYYRDPASCSTYYHCIDGKAMPRVCDPNNFFDPQASQCRWAKLVTDCDNRGLPVYVDKLPVSKFVCPLPNGHYRDPEDCSVFYHCLQDVPYRGACRRHHAFDVDLLTCVPRSEVPGCKQNHVTEEKDVWGKEEARKDEGARGVSQGLTTTVKTVDTKSDSTTRKSSNAKGDFQCPEAHGLFRDPQDCRVFYHCFSGRHFRHECQFGTVFSTERNLCTWPALVPDCPLATQSPEVTSQDAQDNIESTEEWISDNLPADFKHDHQHDAPAPSRPSKSTTTPRVVTKKTDVTKSRDNVTKSPSDVIEVQDDVSEAQPYISQEVNSAAEIEPFDYDQGEVHTPKASSDGLNNFIVEAAVPNGFRSDPFNEFICPQLIFDQYFRDPIDCTRFHRCVKGLRFTFDCPRGTFFDPVFNICDFQEKVPDCDHEGRRLGTSREPMGSDNEVSIPLYTGNGGEYMTENSLDFPVADPMCPRSDGLFPHPSSCNKFVYCARGSPVVLTCPADLLYNVDTMTCDYQDKIVCIQYDK
ncbi:uncharacterized protein [Littorina saxatilis]|uniref:Chitin-binding type-2 domain-containing protein n=1 Tax=Littorina saxatilis TaxID=31220 RepID=A0AAN9FVH5_9CAEN